MSKKRPRRSFVTKKIICKHCESEIKEDSDDFIQCDKCEKNFHFKCSKLTRKEFERLLKDESELYSCQLCAKDNGETKEELKKINIDLKKLEKLEKLDQLMDSITFMSEKFDEVIKDVEQNKKKINEVEKENRKLKNEIQSLKSSVKILNDVRVKNDCIISGLEVENNTNEVDAVLDLSKKIGVSFESNCVEDAYFMQNRNKNQQAGKKTVVVKFANKLHKDKLMSVKPKLKENENTKTIYINEYLSKETLSLLYHAKSLRAIGYQHIYAKHGRVYCKKSDIARQIFIRSEEDVDRMLLEATTNKHWNRRSMVQHREVPDVEDTEDGDDGANYLSP